MTHTLFDALSALFPMGLSGLIFDCDGVLVDSCGANVGYYNRLLAEFGLPPMPEAHEEYVQMASAEQAFEFLFTPEQRKLLPDIFKRLPYNDITLPLLEPEPGLKEMLLALHGRGVRLAVHTNRREGIWDVLRKFGIDTVFDPVMNAVNALPKPSPDGVYKILAAWKVPAGTVGFLGDSRSDAEAAAGAGVPLIAYRSEKLAAAVHADSFPELQKVLLSLPLFGEA